MSSEHEILNHLGINGISADIIRKNALEYSVYASSVQEIEGSLLFLVREEDGRRLVIINPCTILDDFAGDEYHDGKVRICPADKSNLKPLWRHFPFTRPIAYADKPVTIGLGDRLGIATPGHIKAIKETVAFPVLAQQSMRELNFTGRTYEDVLSTAAWSVFQEGYKSGYGADGDHLKTADEIKMALDIGMTMITLDCSDYIDNTIEGLEFHELSARYQKLPEKPRLEMESRYLGREFEISPDLCLSFSISDLMGLILIYHRAIEYIKSIYYEVISRSERAVDFEISIDETKTPTSPLAHYFVASELKQADVAFTSLAPRFCGEFQKGIDYIGDKEKFTQEFTDHVGIAEFFGTYKISVHSGSDKFSIFPIVGAKTRQFFHLKTAGTSWLEAIRVIALHAPDLYREIHSFSLENLEEAKKYYVISADTSRISDISQVNDSGLADLMDDPDARQLIHISYGLILNARRSDGSSRFRARMYAIWYKHDPDYAAALARHIGRHLADLGVKKNNEGIE